MKTIGKHQSRKDSSVVSSSVTSTSDLDVLRDLTPVDEFSGVVGFIELDDFLVVDFVVRLSTRGCFKRFQQSLLEVL